MREVLSGHASRFTHHGLPPEFLKSHPFSSVYLKQKSHEVGLVAEKQG
jgi:hypothetical protein